ncbi:rootletin-like [Pollicipes pollicipes]|uniref:rootletin-like n=1 Tax=Pollicipes pollicipes TaxID=41117 RepID=UPI001885A20C|nr:rootletin-like [Pollicipes pollicipes]
MAGGARLLRLLLRRVKLLLRSQRLTHRPQSYPSSPRVAYVELVSTEKAGGLLTTSEVTQSAGLVTSEPPKQPLGDTTSHRSPRTLQVPPIWRVTPPAGRPVEPLPPKACGASHWEAETSAENEDQQQDSDIMDETDRMAQLERKNSELQRELTSVQDMLSTSRAERDDIGIKYGALTDRLDRMMKPAEEALAYEPSTSRAASAGRTDAVRSTAIDTLGRGRRLEEENQAFRRRLGTYQESQRQQALVVNKLQDKVRQYKQRCSELEERMTDSGRRLAASDQQLQQRQQERLQTSERQHDLDLETALVRLEEAENRCVTLSDVNGLLREQLDAAQEANEALTGEIQKLTADWQRLRDELEHKELDWKEEEQTFNEYYNAEHARMLKLWKEIVGFRRDFSELKLGTERDLSRVRSEMARLARQTADACSTVHTGAAAPSPGGVTPQPAGQGPVTRKQVSQISAAFSNASMWEKLQDVQKQETTFRVKKRELETKIKDLSNQVDIARSEIVEKDKIVTSLNKMVHTLESNTAELGQKLESHRHVAEENDVLTQAIREVAQLVVDDAERTGEPEDKVTVLVKSTSLARTETRRLLGGRMPSQCFRTGQARTDLLRPCAPRRAAVSET